MRLPTNNLALAAVGFAAFVLIAPIVLVIAYLLRLWKSRAHRASHRKRSMLQDLLDHIFQVRF